MNAKSVLFLCVANSARSQMAEGLARERYGDRLKFISAGSQPSRVNPFATEVMRESGISLANHRSKSVTEIDAAEVGLVITLCAEEVCPVFLGSVERWHWPFEDPDPKNQKISREETRRRFRRTRDAIRQRLEAERPRLLAHATS